MHECQTRGLVPGWDIFKYPHAPQGTIQWIGSVKVGDKTVNLHEPQPSKKDVKGILAEKSIPMVKMMISRGKPALPAFQVDDDGVNWIGKLLGRLDFHYFLMKEIFVVIRVPSCCLIPVPCHLPPHIYS